MSNKKISQFPVVTTLNGTTYVPVIQGSPLFDAIISASNFASSMQDYNDNYYIKVDGTNSDIDYLNFNPDAVGDPQPYVRKWDATEGTFIFGLPDGGIIQEGKELFDYYVNADTVPLVNGDVVSIVPISGNRKAVARTNVTDAQSAKNVIGMVTVASIAVGASGRITKFGEVHDLITTLYPDGTELFVSESLPGKWATVASTPPNYTVRIGTVIVSQNGNGIVELGVQCFPKLGDLSDVNGVAYSVNKPIVRKADGVIDAIDTALDVDGITPSSGTLTITGDLSVDDITSDVVGAATVNVVDLNATDVESTNGFVKTGSSDNQVLLGAGGTKNVADFQLKSEKGQANGYASLGADGLVPATQLPSFVDDVIEVANYAALPITGETGKIYVTLDTNKTYRWSGSTYVYITSGAVDSVAGKTGVVTLVKADVGLANVDNTSDANKPVSTATQTALNGKVNNTDIEQTRSQSTSKVPSSKLVDDELKIIYNKQISELLNDAITANSVNTLNLITNQQYTKGNIKRLRINATTAGDATFIILRKLTETPTFEIIEEFTQSLSVGINDIVLNKYISENFYFGIKRGSTTFKVSDGATGSAYTLYFNSDLSITGTSSWSNGGLRSHNIEITIVNSDVFQPKQDMLLETDSKTIIGAINELKNINGTEYTSYPFNESYNTGTVTSLNMTTTEDIPAGIVKYIKFNAAARGILKCALLRKLTANTYKVLKYINVTAQAGVNTIYLNEIIDEVFHFAILSGSVQIYTANGAHGASVNLQYTSTNPFLDGTVWSDGGTRSHNIEVYVERVGLTNSKQTGKSICLCGDSITDFCDSVSSDGRQYIGFDKHLNREIKFTEIINMGYSGIKLAQTGGFADTKVSLLPIADTYLVFLGTNDFALATQTTLGTFADYANTTGINTFYGALRTLINGIYAKNSNAEILLLTPSHRNYSSLNSWNSTNSNGNTLNQFADAIREVGNYMGVKVIDLFKYGKINMNTFSETTYDNLHPNTKGYQYIAEAIINEIK